MSRQDIDTKKLMAREFHFIDPIKLTPCGHIFSKKSLQQEQPNVCPCCWADVESSCSPSESTMRDLASTPDGRNYLQNELKVTDKSGTKQYFFGNDEISAESLQTEVNGRSIRDWLDMSNERRDLKLEEEIRIARKKPAQPRLFASRGTESAAAGNHPYSEEVNTLLQLVVCGEEDEVKAKLEEAKSDSIQLSVLLNNTGTAKDKSGRTINQMTLLQAAAAAGDVEMCQMLKDYMDEDNFNQQLNKLFSKGIDAHKAQQQQGVFKFNYIFDAINQATNDALDVALSKEGAQFTQTDTARNKPDGDLTLVEALNRFREQFSDLSKKEKIFNPYHLLRAYEVYNELYSRYNNHKDLISYADRKKIDLCWRQMVGWVQYFVPACYAQAFVQDLSYLVKVKEHKDNNNWPLKKLERNFNFKCTSHSYLDYEGVTSDCRSGNSLLHYWGRIKEKNQVVPSAPVCCSGLAFDFAILAQLRYPWMGASWPGNVSQSAAEESHAFLKAFVEQKQENFRVLCTSSDLSQSHTIVAP